MDLFSLLLKSLPLSFPVACRIYNLRGSSAALLLALGQDPFTAVDKDEASAWTLRKDILFFRGVFGGNPPFFLPDPEGTSGAGLRARAVFEAGRNDSLITSAKNLTAPLWDKASLERRMLTLSTGSSCPRDEFESLLGEMGYSRSPMVVQRGQYSRREFIIDVFPSTYDLPVRIEFFGDEIESIRTFDTDTQRSQDETAKLTLYPACEEDSGSLLINLNPNSRFYCLYPARSTETLPEQTVFLSRYSFEAGVQAAATDDSDEEDGADIPQIDAGTISMKGLGILAEERKGTDELPGNISKLGKIKIVIVASSQGQAERVRQIMREGDLIAPLVGMDELSAYKGQFSITVGELSSGLFMNGVMVLTEKELFGERTSVRQVKKSRVANIIGSVDEVSPGDFVVHREHGIGRFTGVNRQEIDGVVQEMMTIEYENGRLSIPVHNIGTISGYRSKEGVLPRIDSLGGKAWQKRKENVRKKVHEMAERLIALYAGRKSVRGFTFSPDSELHREFDGFFAYEETPDQLKAISDIKNDMESERPMDRLLCGDVGYGKTEVAMRAAFKAVYDNRQVAVLVPTTILADQHFRTFKERFSGFPVTIDFISRFKPKKLNDLALRVIETGETDIIIGTHGLLSKKVAFSRLGLLIVDEEHRFGVGQKEKIKELAKNIDVLNLTATPIPRTLHMALSGIRDMSVIETPPEERLAVKSTVTVISDSLIRDAVTSEMKRGGQLFFVHNRIHDIFKMAHHIQQLVPLARIAVGHGQMAEKELEEVMHRFFEGETDVLVSTAIIGSGLDVPRANTIMINMADRMGLADLYQLRGRVGRSRQKGYAFFLAPPESLLTDEAKKRLQAVQEMSYLGAGFRLAMKDLEIRGAGDVFGPDQSGHIHEIGFDLYIEMLENAVAELKGVEIRPEFEPVMELRAPAFISEEYIEDLNIRLGFYRRVASMKTEKEVDEFYAELDDRFGGPPAEFVNLLNVMRLKVLARRLMIAKISETGQSVRVSFSSGTSVQPEQLFELQKAGKKGIRFFPDGFEIDIRNISSEKTFALVEKALRNLAGTC